LLYYDWKKECRVIDLRNINGEQKIVLVFYLRPDKITNPKLPINDLPIFEEIEDVGDLDYVELEEESNYNYKEFGGNKKRTNRKRTNRKRTNKKRTNRKRTNRKRTNKRV